jgi:hypothetical protein
MVKQDGGRAEKVPDKKEVTNETSPNPSGSNSPSSDDQ